MKTFKKAFVFGLTVFIMITMDSCKKSFLNQTPYSSVPASGAIQSVADLYSATIGLYSSLRATDFYGRTYAIKGDLLSDNCFLSTANSGRYLVFNQLNMSKTDGYASNVWLNGYSAIKNANLIINSGFPVSGVDSTNISQLYSEAYALRGMILFDLCRNFAVPYAAGASNLGVPIVLKFDQNAKPARDTISKVYAQVLSDLNKAMSYSRFNQGSTMTFITTGQTRSMNSSYVTKYVIDGLLARVYQNMGDWANAKAAVLDIVNNGGFSLTNSNALVGYWAGTTPRTDKVETMFEVTSDANNSVSDGTLANLYVPKATGGSYGDILATKPLYDSYTSTDTRKLLYKPSTRSGQLGTALYVTKYPIDNVNFDDVKIVRYAEVLLILAEAYYNLGDNANALKYLNMVAQKRDPSLVAYATTGTATLEQILTERQKELAFEGYRFFDLYRLQRSFNKPTGQDANNNLIYLTASNAVSTISFTPSNTVNWLFPIPYDEILVNSNVLQNTGY